MLHAFASSLWSSPLLAPKVSPEVLVAAPALTPEPCLGTAELRVGEVTVGDWGGNSWAWLPPPT